ncbi:hypothetical protein [Laspinema olomoucense]|uniref:Uncharacterized protein n=1 Tax=Laspinema olomoucense D3b TaxID=2953688 RepID=A0ABT2N8C2_9CYAN|nr:MULTISPECIES: hypothetical protein [unclassified Laspinema]MCT7970735.1 hypothetical protein [Laspinema sp. D3d]MCT7978104.1 hypothetical protein [Laspinema sp. D3b]MCT7993673.1 hypothetical protein [Laspinema sp. D3c]
MKKVAKLTRESVWENQLKGNLTTIEEIRTDTLNDLQLLSEDFQHLHLVVTSVQQNYAALLKQNRQMRAMLLQVVDECFCWQGNRCDRCNAIFQLLSNRQLE